MRTDCPILFLSDHTPALVEHGLVIRCSRTHGGPDGGATWIHGALVLDPAERSLERQTHWLRAMNVILVEEADAAPAAAPLLAGDAPPEMRMIEARLDGGEAAAVLPFSFDLRDRLGDRLTRDAYYAHVSTREHCSRPARIVRAEWACPTHLGAIPPHPGRDEARYPAVNGLIEAYDASSHGDDLRAVALFSRALADTAIHGDLSRPHLFNAAQAASRAALSADADKARSLLSQAVTWLAADRALRADLLLRIQDALAAADSDAQRAALTRARARLLDDLDLT